MRSASVFSAAPKPQQSTSHRRELGKLILGVILPSTDFAGFNSVNTDFITWHMTFAGIRDDLSPHEFPSGVALGG